MGVYIAGEIAETLRWAATDRQMVEFLPHIVTSDWTFYHWQ